MQSVDQILSLIAQYGYLVIFVGVLLESAGVPIPGETILIASGVLVQQGHLDLGDAMVFGILGAVAGDQIGYWAGREGGRPFVLKWGRYVKITPERLARAEGFFARHGGKAVFLARFVAGLRVFGALVAGISRMHWRTFFFYNTLGGAIWATAAVAAGYLLGGSLGLVERWVSRASILLVVLLVLGAALYLSYRWVRNHPETLRRAAVRLGGERLRTFPQSPTGLWLRRRFSPSGVYGLTLTVGLLLTGTFSWAFGGIAEDVLSRDPLVRVDLAVLNFFHSNEHPYLTDAVVVFETVFSPEVLLVAATLAGAALLFLARKRGDFGMGFSGVALLASAFGTGALIGLFKFLFDRPRPPSSLQLVTEAGYAFPSGYAMAALVVGASAWYLFSLRSPQAWWGSWRAKARVGFAVVGVVLLIGIGRVYTGANYPSDVLAGWALGGVWASLCLTAAEVFRRFHESDKALPESYKRLGAQYSRFSLIGVSNALVDLGVLNLLLILEPTRSSWILVLYNLVALVLANVNSYLWNTLWTFKHQTRHDARQVGLFSAQAVVNVAAGTLLFWLAANVLESYAGFSPQVGGNVAKVISMFAASTVSFLFLRFFVFRPGKG